MEKFSSIKNLIERVKLKRLFSRNTASPEFTREMSINTLQNDNLSLSNRKKVYYQEIPVYSKEFISKIKRVKTKLKGFKLWLSIHQKVKQIGTNSSLFDAHEAYRRNLDIIMEGKKRKVLAEEMLTKKHCLLLPDSEFKNYWYFIILVVIFYVITAMPLMMAFYEYSTTSIVFYFELFIDVIFLVDMVIIFNSAYIDSRGILHLSRWDICKNYMTGFFLPDFIAIFPFWIFSDFTSAKTQSVSRIARIAKISRIIRISKIVPMIRSMTDSKSLSPIFELLLNYRGTARLFTIFYLIIIISHFISCIWYYIARIDGIYPDSWVARYDFVDDSFSVLYLRGLYFALSVTNTVGFGDISPFKIIEISVCIVIMMFGICIYSFLVATLTSILISLDTKSSRLYAKKSILDELFKKYRISRDLKNEIKSYMKNSKDGDVEDFSETLKELPEKLQYFLVMSMYNQAPSRIQLFVTSDERFCIELIPKLISKELQNNEFVYFKGSLPYEFYLIGKGKVNYVFGKNNVQIKSFNDGSYFGEVELVKYCPRKFSALTGGYCQLFVVTNKIFSQTLYKFPKFSKEIQKKCIVQSVKDNQAFNDVLDVIEKTEISKTFSLSELAGKKKAKKFNFKNKSVLATMYFKKASESASIRKPNRVLVDAYSEIQEVKNKINVLNQLIQNL